MLNDALIVYDSVFSNTEKIAQAIERAIGDSLGSLEKKGGKRAIPPEGFLVMGEQGPLKDGELERAANWAKSL
jgi:flavodoxin I